MPLTGIQATGRIATSRSIRRSKATFATIRRQPLTFTLELKDYRDSYVHRADRSYTIPAGGAWTKIEAPLDLSSGWTVNGTPDLTRTFAVSFLVDEILGPLNGSLYLDDFNLIENGPSIDVATAPITTIVERLAKRQFMGAVGGGNKTSGLIPNSSDNVAIGALNTTTGVVWNLPSAIRRGWVTQSDADAYMGQLVDIAEHEPQPDHLSADAIPRPWRRPRR